jgi:hypothetical protein
MGVVVHAYNPSYSGGRDRSIASQSKARLDKNVKCYLKKY